MDSYYAQIILFGGNYAPRNWADCDGREIKIVDNEALFSLLGTTYGGDGRTTFNLPKLDAPEPGLRYIICVEGIWPPRN